ncbi:hypothetical protein ACTMS0_10850 [Micromonospora sp. H33]|uniref:hypothetical protein n=1 Tax=Micromonospora sp. H33 TaxID=3452215 RepID=UPI003F8A2178
MNLTRTLVRIAAAVALALAGLAVAPGSAASAATCDVHIGTTYKSGSQIVGYGSMANCGSGQATLKIQKETCWDCWSQVGSSVTFTGSGYDKYIYYNCKGTGTQTYRTLITGKTIGGAYKTKASNKIRVTC